MGTNLELIGGFVIGTGVTLLGAAFWHSYNRSFEQAGRPAPAVSLGVDDFAQIASAHTSDGLVIMNIRGEILWVNPAYCALMGYTPEELIGRHPLSFAPLPEDRWSEAALADYRLDLHMDLINARETRLNTRKDGSTFWNEITTTLHEVADGQTYAVLVCRDASRQVERESRLEQTSQRLSYLATHDDLTGVANRSVMTEFLETALQKARNAGTTIGVLHVDLDEFKQINDTFGHAAGDKVLKSTAARLKAAARPMDLVARVGGDEFIVVCDGLRSLDTLRMIGETLLGQANQPISFQSAQIDCKVSIGAALAQSPETSSDDLIGQSDFALYEVKRKRRGQVAIYNSDLHNRHIRAVAMDEAFATALARGELVFHFQPVVDRSARIIRGLETLARWDHPTEGLIGPDELTVMAERLGLMADLDLAAMNAALDMKQNLNAWGHAEILTSFNVSADLLRLPALQDRLLSGLSFRGLTPEDVILEVVEKVVFDAEGANNPIVQTVADLDAAGLFVALDDFGRGNAGIAQLPRLAVKAVKFDKSLATNILHDPTLATIYHTLTGLCAALDLRTVTEGVETPEQAARLKELGCTNIQGFLVAKPMPAEAVHDWISTYPGSAIAPAEAHRYLGSR